MFIERIFIAFVLLQCVSAHAITRISGSKSADRVVVRALTQMCSSGNYKILKTDPTSNNLGYVFTVTCDTTFKIVRNGYVDSSGETEVRFNLIYSAQAVLFSQLAADNNEPLARNGAYLPGYDTSQCTQITGQGSLAYAGNKLYTCTRSLEYSEKSVGGFLDIETEVLKATGVLDGDYSTDRGTLSHVYGVAASKDLYEALQASQALTIGSTDRANQPSVSKAKLASLLNNNNFNAAKASGPKFLVPNTIKTNVSYCREPYETESSVLSNVYFMANPVATGELGGAMQIHGPETADGPASEVVVGQDAQGNPTGNTFTVKISRSVDFIKNCLNAGGFALGILSAENNPVGSSDTYRFIKIDGMSVTGGVQNDPNVSAAIAGDYDFVYERRVFNPQANRLLRLLNEYIGGSYQYNANGVFRNTEAVYPESYFGRDFISTSPYVVHQRNAP